MRKHRTLAALPLDESSEERRVRLRRFALATRDDARASATATIPFPEQTSVLAGPLRRVRPAGTGPARADRIAGEPDRDDEGG